VGIVAGRPPHTGEELLAHADAAMYRAKDDRAGGGKVTVLDESERHQIMRQLRIRREIAEPALEQFHVLYQPIIELSEGEIRGFEALLRWEHPELGEIPPSLFIPLAEQAGSIGELGHFVLERAIRDLARLQWSVRHRRLFVGVNVSPRQLARPDFVKTTQSMLAANGVRPWQLMLEITEHAFAKNLKPVEEAVTRLAAAEIAIAIDDFGTGYSTLHYLERLQPSVMKIDRSFISGDTVTEASRRLVGSLITMAKVLGLRLIAEGIETSEQLDFLREVGCGLGQGYLFSRPVDLEETERLLRSNPRGLDGWRTAKAAAATPSSNLSSSAVVLPQPYPSFRAGQG
jgi:EAL domain-containing protein (putative c-di-GMP-specific phosphodiesterase class I)